MQYITLDTTKVSRFEDDSLKHVHDLINSSLQAANERCSFMQEHSQDTDAGKGR